MIAPKSYIETASQHWFSKSRWSQHSETAFKVHLPFRVIKLHNSSLWPTDYILYCYISVWLGSGSFGTCLLLWPAVVAICRRKSPRLLAVVGGLVAALGILFLSFSTQTHQLFISYVCVVGTGTSITLATSSIIVGRYSSII